MDTLADLRAQSFGTEMQEARSWLRNMAGLDNVLVLERAGTDGKPGIPAALLGAVPVECGHRRGVWFCGMLTRPELRGRGLMSHLLDTCLRAYAAGDVYKRQPMGWTQYGTSRYCALQRRDLPEAPN